MKTVLKIILFAGYLAGFFLGFVPFISKITHQNELILSFVIILGIIIPIFFLAPVANLGLIGGLNKKQRKVLASGKKAKATITAVDDLALTVNNTQYGVRIHLRVEPTSGKSFQAKVETLASRLAVPRAGDKVNVRYDPKDPQSVVLDQSAT